MSLYGLIIGICLVILLDYFSHRNTIIPKNRETVFFIFLLVFTLVGARAYHVLDQWSFYTQNPILIFNTRGGGLGIFGALIAAALYLLFISLIFHKSYIILLDLFTPILPLCQAIGRLANFINHENPIWWLESILDLSLFLILLWSPKNPTAKYLIGYGIIRIITEIWRLDTWVLGGIKIGQLIGFIFISFGLILLKSEKRSPITPGHS